MTHDHDHDHEDDNASAAAAAVVGNDDGGSQWAAHDGLRATDDGLRAAGDGRWATGDGRQTTGAQVEEQHLWRSVRDFLLDFGELSARVKQD